MKANRWVTLGLTVCIIVTAAPALAERYVVVNGARMGLPDLQYLDRISCSYIADGNYWLDTNSGLWGYAGGGAQGYITDNCNTRRRGLSERGLLYSPGELLR
ncbi:hypothetical protein [Sedimenticola selenatireducens]|uniref:hypothetical protein n=1 Tax=Sedimenticola selenatireducens TaxID=191960 RepID=UPI002AABE286|nr:hypothetical protein [Sedimenticola selenatireducens]